MPLVLDASIALSWQIQRTDSQEVLQSHAALRHTMSIGALIPALWYSEVANGLLIAERQKALTLAQSTRFLADIASLPLNLDQVAPNTSYTQAVGIGRQYTLTAYDATYLELALRTASTLATFDRKLAEAARTAGVPVFGDAR